MHILILRNHCYTMLHILHSNYWDCMIYCTYCITVLYVLYITALLSGRALPLLLLYCMVQLSVWPKATSPPQELERGAYSDFIVLQYLIMIVNTILKQDNLMNIYK